MELWRVLYAAAQAFQDQAPWRWMSDAEILGINNEHGVRLISVLGAMGEVYGLASYRGTAGANILLELLAGEIDPASDEIAFRQDACLVDFVPRAELRVEDRALVAQLKLTPPPGSSKRFPEFQSHKPGYLPWFVDATEARQLLDDLRKIIRFAQLVREHPDMYAGRRENEFAFLPQTVTEPLTVGQLEWHTLVPAQPQPEPPLNTGDFELAGLRALPRAASSAWELSAFYSPRPINEPPRPYFFKTALALEVPSGAALAYELTSPDQGTNQTVAQVLIKAIKTTGRRPGSVQIESAALLASLRPLAEVLDLKLRLVKSLPLTRAARDDFEKFGAEA